MKRLWGGVLIAAGILIAGLSGLCMLYSLVSSVLFAMGSVVGTLGMLLMTLLYGAVPLAAGIGSILGGRSLLRRANEEEGRPE